MSFILIPIAAALIGGWWDARKFVVSGIQSLASVVGMFVFAINGSRVPFPFGASVVMTIACVALGVFPS